MATILIIEDEASILMLMQRLVTRMGHQVLAAADGQAALDLARSQSVQLIITDYTLPGEWKGLPLIGALRDLHPHCPVVVSSGMATRETVEELRQGGVGHFLNKPFEIDALRKLVTDLVGPAPQSKP